MRLGVISDIHSNIYAFRAAMEYLEGKDCEEYVFLGDFVSDTSYPHETMEYLYEIMKKYPCHILRGNREEYMLQQRQVMRGESDAPRWKSNSSSGNLLYTYERLTGEDLDFFERLPITFVYEKEGYPAITFCHGSPTNSRELMQFGAENTKEWMKKISTDYLIAAHTHRPGAFYENGRAYFNTGSCGISIEDCDRAECMLLESVEEDGKVIWKPEFVRACYDAKRVVEDIFKSGLYEQAPWFLNANIHIFLTGFDKCAEMVVRAMELQKEATGKAVVWPDIEEEYFMEAAKELGIPDYSDWMKTGKA